MSTRTFSPDVLARAAREVLPPGQRERTQVEVTRPASRDTIAVRMSRRGHHAQLEVDGRVMMAAQDNGADLLLRNIQDLSRELPPALETVALLYDREGRFVRAERTFGGNAIVLPDFQSTAFGSALANTGITRRVFNRVGGMYERGDNQPAVLVYQEGWERGVDGLRREGGPQRAWRALDVDEVESEYQRDYLGQWIDEAAELPGVPVLHPRPPRSDGVIHLARFGAVVAEGRALAARLVLSNVGTAVALAMENPVCKRGALLELEDTPTGPAPEDSPDSAIRFSLLELE